MQNPFDVIIEKLNSLEEKLQTNSSIPTPPKPEIITRAELCRRLDMSEPTIIKLEKKGKIPNVRAGNVIRYNWPAVVAALSS